MMKTNKQIMVAIFVMCIVASCSWMSYARPRDEQLFLGKICSANAPCLTGVWNCSFAPPPYQGQYWTVISETSYPRCTDVGASEFDICTYDDVLKECARLARYTGTPCNSGNRINDIVLRSYECTLPPK